MELQIEKGELTKLLLVTQTVAEKKSTMPILGNFLIRTEQNKLFIVASDLELTAVSTGTADVKNPGSVTVSAKVFSDVVRELPDGPVVIKVLDRSRIEIRSGRSNLKLVGTSAEEYPVPKALSLSVKSRVPAKLLLEMIQKTLYAVSLDEGRFTMNGVCIEVESSDNSLRLVATDGHRLAYIQRPMGGLMLTGLSKATGKSNDHAIVPRKGLAEIKKLLEAEASGEVGIDINEGFLVVESGTTKLVVRLIDGEYPDYGAVIPKTTGTRATVLSTNLTQALKRVALVVSDRSKGVRFDIDDSTLRISSSSPELGEASEELEIDYKGAPLKVGFNARYLLDVLATVGEPQSFVMEFFGETGPGKFFTETDESGLAIVMPLRLD
jgi:DNA polymerase III subunit beta